MLLVDIVDIFHFICCFFLFLFCAFILKSSFGTTKPCIYMYICIRHKHLDYHLSWIVEPILNGGIYRSVEVMAINMILEGNKL